jgi:protein O-mannosyl-transferase
LPLWAAAAVLAVFLPTLSNGFVTWDDPANILENPLFHRPWREALGWSFTAFHAGHYTPLAWVTLLADHHLWNGSPAGFHLTNLLLHAANAALAVLLARDFFRRAGRESDWSPLAAALLFALHPLRVESVAWLTQRRDLLAAFFLLLAARAYLAGSARRCMSFYLLSLFSKPVGMVFPVVLTVLDVYPLRRLPGEVRRWNDHEWSAIWAEKIPFWAAAGLFAALAGAAQVAVKAAWSWRDHGLMDRLAQGGRGLCFALGKTAWPAGLSPLYEFPPAFSWVRPESVMAMAAVLGITVALLRVRRRWPAGLAAWVVFLAFMAPTSGLFQSGPQFVADRYTYLACLPWALLAGAGITRLSPARTAALTGVIGALLGGLSWRQARFWKDGVTLWERAVSVPPKTAVKINHLGNALVLEREDAVSWERAVGLFDEAIRRAPTEKSMDVLWQAHGNRGYALLRLGRNEEAEKSLRASLVLRPEYPEALNNLGLLLLEKDPRGAEDCLRRALRADPMDMEAANNLAVALARQGRVAEARSVLEQGLRLRPEDPRLRQNLSLLPPAR